MFHPSHVVEGRLNCLNCGAEAWEPAIGQPCPMARVEAAPPPVAYRVSCPACLDAVPGSVCPSCGCTTS